jgi:hypothetical protein
MGFFGVSHWILLMRSGCSRVDEIADKLSRQWQESGETLESMLATLQEVREEYEANKP